MALLLATGGFERPLLLRDSEGARFGATNPRRRKKLPKGWL